MHVKKFIAVAAFASVCCGVMAQSAPQLGKASIEKIVKGMTLEEKAYLLVGNEQDRKFAFMAGSAGCTGYIERLGISATQMFDGATGLRMDSIDKQTGKKYFCTGFPISTLMAASWNVDAMGEVADAIAKEMIAFDADMILAPSINIHRNPLNGRNFEYYSEDPLLSGKMGAAYITALQKNGVGAVVKHYACNDQQTMRMFNDSRLTQRALREIYLKNFEIAVKEGRPWGVMSSYNSVNGTSAQYNIPLLIDVLRGEWKYQGVVMTDWGDPRDTKRQVHAGNDLLMGGTPSQVQDIIKSVKDGTLSMADVDRNVKRVLAYILKTHSFKGLRGDKNPDLKTHARISRRAAAEGMVLLKNQKSALPLQKNDSIALFGIGNVNYYANGRGAADVNKAYTINIPQALKSHGVYIQPTLERFYSEYVKACNVQLEEINTPTWRNWFFGFKQPTEPYMEPKFIANRAADCTKAIITISRNAGESEDRDYIKGDYLLTEREQELVSEVSRAFHAKGKKVIVVLNTGGAMDVASWRDKVDAILIAWQPGQEGGNAVADILTGEVNPSGKLPMTLAKDYFDIPSSKNFPLHYVFSWDELLRPSKEVMAKKNLGFTNYDEDIWVGYRYFNTRHKAVAYPFGYGLSYTTFEYTEPKVSRRGNTITVSVNVKNTGKVAGKEVVELYSSAPKGKLEKPLRELKAFVKTSLLKPNESQRVSMTLNVRDLASFDDTLMQWVADAGTYTLGFGASVEDIRCNASLKLEKQYTESAPTIVGNIFKPSPIE